MEKYILIIIVIAFFIYKIIDRICEAYEDTHMESSEEYNIIEDLIGQNEKLTDELLKKED